MNSTGHGALRIIPCLDVHEGKVVKGTRFVDLAHAGDPLELALRYEAEGADEIAFLDISATIEGRRTALAAIEAIRAQLGIPLLVGGGVRSIADGQRLLEAGADRVAVNSAACADPSIIDSLAARFGTQCIVVAIDALHTEAGARVVIHSGKTVTEREPCAWAREAQARGAGEVLFTSIDRDGTRSGYNLELLSAMTSAVTIPVIASGGASTLAHFLEGAHCKARALLAAGVFHRGEISIRDVKDFLAREHLEVRRC